MHMNSGRFNLQIACVLHYHEIAVCLKNIHIHDLPIVKVLAILLLFLLLVFKQFQQLNRLP